MHPYSADTTDVFNVTSIVESVAGDHCGGLRSHWLVGSNWQHHARLHVVRHGVETLEWYAGKSTQADCTVAFAAGSSREVDWALDRSWHHGTQHGMRALHSKFLFSHLNVVTESSCSFDMWLLCCCCCPLQTFSSFTFSISVSFLQC